jgi:hypothetical protein
MPTDSTKPAILAPEGEHFLCDDWFDPLETGVRTRIRGFIEELLEAELDAALDGIGISGLRWPAANLPGALSARVTIIGSAV